MTFDEDANTLAHRYTESLLPIDAPVYFLGVARADSGIGAGPGPADAPVVEPPSMKGGEVVSTLPPSRDKERSPNGTKVAYNSLGKQTSNPLGDWTVHVVNASNCGSRKNLSNNGDGPTANDPVDANTGATGLQNKPDVRTAKAGGGKTTMGARLNRTFTAQFSLPSTGGEVHETEVRHHRRIGQRDLLPSRRWA